MKTFDMSFTKILILFQYLFMKKLLISSELFITCKSMINFPSLRFNISIHFLDTSYIRIGLTFMILNLGSDVSEDLLFLCFKENPDSFILYVAT